MTLQLVFVRGYLAVQTVGVGLCSGFLDSLENP